MSQVLCIIVCFILPYIFFIKINSLYAQEAVNNSGNNAGVAFSDSAVTDADVSPQADQEATTIDSAIPKGTLTNDSKGKSPDDTVSPTSMSMFASGPESSQVMGAKAFGMAGVNISNPSNGGAARMDIPIEVPPGRGGVAPHLTIAYNSRKGNGQLGVGFSMDLGAIQRSAKYGVNYNADDYVINDSSEIVLRPEWGSNYYGAKIEGAFTKYYKNPSGGWIATAKDGTTYFYGTTSASRQENANGIFSWCLDRVEDTNGNYMTALYWKDQGEIYPSRINYTGNTAGLNPTNFVQFYYEGRTDTPVMFHTNSSIITAYRMKSIAVLANGSTARAYKLTYANNGNTGQTLLANVQQYGSDFTIDANGTITGGKRSVTDHLRQHNHE